MEESKPGVDKLEQNLSVWQQTCAAMWLRFAMCVALTPSGRLPINNQRLFQDIAFPIRNTGTLSAFQVFRLYGRNCRDRRKWGRLHTKYCTSVNNTSYKFSIQNTLKIHFLLSRLAELKKQASGHGPVSRHNTTNRTTSSNNPTRYQTTQVTGPSDDKYSTGSSPQSPILYDHRSRLRQVDVRSTPGGPCIPASR